MTAIAVRSSAVEKMEHAIGFQIDRVKRGKYITFRNHFAAPRSDDNDWIHLVNIGYAKRGEITQNCIMYHVTRTGMDFIERITGVTIVEED